MLLRTRYECEKCNRFTVVDAFDIILHRVILMVTTNWEEGGRWGMLLFLWKTFSRALKSRHRMKGKKKKERRSRATVEIAEIQEGHEAIDAGNNIPIVFSQFLFLSRSWSGVRPSVLNLPPHSIISFSAATRNEPHAMEVKRYALPRKLKLPEQ